MGNVRVLAPADSTNDVHVLHGCAGVPGLRGVQLLQACLSELDRAIRRATVLPDGDLLAGARRRRVEVAEARTRRWAWGWSVRGRAAARYRPDEEGDEPHGAGNNRSVAPRAQLVRNGEGRRRAAHEISRRRQAGVCHRRSLRHGSATFILPSRGSRPPCKGARRSFTPKRKCSRATSFIFGRAIASIAAGRMRSLWMNFRRRSSFPDGGGTGCGERDPFSVTRRFPSLRSPLSCERSSSR